MFAWMTMAGISLAVAGSPTARQAAGFQRQTPHVATDGVKPMGAVRRGRVSRESLAIAACRARASRQGQASFGEMRLVGRLTYRVAGTITPAPSRRKAGQNRRWTYSCTVRGEGEILDFETRPAR